MPESGLSIGFAELAGEVGRFLGYGYKAYASYSADRQTIINRYVQSGVRQVYYPPAVIIGGQNIVGYEWSWLRPTTTLATISGTGDYDLPDDFGRLVGVFNYPADEHRISIVVVSVSKLLQLRAYSNLKTAPTHAAIRYKASDGTTGQRQEVLFYPEPDDDWTLSYEYEAYNGVISSTYPYPLGGMQLAELYIESCLSVCENRANDEVGVHTQKFQMLLMDQISRNMKHGAKHYGCMGHKETTEFPRIVHGYTAGSYPITYLGVPVEDY